MLMNTQEEPQVSITFSQSVDDELRKLNAEMRLISILNMLASDRVPTEVERADLRHLMLVLSDLFSTSLPPLEDNPMETLRSAARDINLSRLLKERGLARMYRLVTLQARAYDQLTNQEVLLPTFMQETNPETGKTFRSQEEFIGWFCKEARVPRSLVFQRMRVYDRLLTLSMSLDEAFDVVLKKPYASREALNEIATWQKGELVGIDPAVAVRVTQVMLPERSAEVEQLVHDLAAASDFQEQEDVREELLEAVKPALAKMIHEVADHPSMRDVMDMVRHDLAGKPEIGYRYNEERGWIEVEYVVKKKDPRGTQYIERVDTFNLIPEKLLPKEVLADLANRLNVKNRDLVL
jgi:hypothetical protein